MVTERRAAELFVRLLDLPPRHLESMLHDIEQAVAQVNNKLESFADKLGSSHALAM